MKYLRFGALATVHTSDDDIGSVFLGVMPERLLSALALDDFSAEELGIAGLSVGVDFGLELLLDEGWLVLEGQVLLGFISDSDHVEAVFVGAKKALHGDFEGQFGSLATVDSDHVIVASVLGGKGAVCVCGFYHISS